MDIQKIHRSAIKPAEYNPRKISDEAKRKLTLSLSEFDLVEPLVWNKRTGNLIGGHQRLFILDERNGTDYEVEASIVDLPPAKEKALNVALNNQLMAGEWDFPKLKDLITEIDTGEFDIEITGFNYKELEKIIGYERAGGNGVAAPEPQIDKADELQEKWKVKRGQIWEIGNHKLLCGDCSDASKLMEKKRYDLLVADPPYGVSYAEKNRFLNAIAKGNRIQEPIENDSATPEEMSKFWIEKFTAIRVFAKPGASYYVTGPQGGDLLLLLLLALCEAKFPLRHMLIWAKNNHVLGRCDYHYKHEPIIYGWVEGARHNFYGERGETSLWEIPKPHNSDFHPTTKPVELYARAIKNSSKRGELICDPFLGSGTTMVAAQQLNRRCYGIEIEPRYCSVILERMSDMGLEPKLLALPRPSKKRRKA